MSRAILVLVLIALSLTLPSYGQPAEPRRKPFEQVRMWQVELSVEYDQVIRSGSTSNTIHATSTWNGIADRENMWVIPTQLDELPWTGNLNVTAEGTKVVVGKKFRITTSTRNKEIDPTQPFFGVYMTNDEYSFHIGYVGLSGLDEVYQQPGQPEKSDRYGTLKYAPAFKIVRPLPDSVQDLSGSVSLDHTSPNQLPDTPLQPGEKAIVTWTFKPVKEMICGPDVTAATTNALIEMENYFYGLHNDAKAAHCEALDAISIQTFLAWDIKELYYGTTAWLDRYTKNGTCCIPGDGVTDDNEDAKTCKHSVRHSNLCVLAGTLNYFTFGQMNRLCHAYALETVSPRNKQLECMVVLGSCSAPGGQVTAAQYESNFRTCVSASGYHGPVFRPTDQECHYRPKMLDPARWDKPAMRNTIENYKSASTEKPDVPTAFAEAAFDNGARAVPPVENRAHCTGVCKRMDKPSAENADNFHWTWCPDRDCKKWYLQPPFRR